MKIFENGKDNGYLAMEDQRWWFDEKHPHAFRIAKLDEDYPAEYFPLAEPPKEAIEAIADYSLEYYDKLTGKGTRPSIIEFGSAAGWLAKEFIRRNLNYQGIEGSKGAMTFSDRWFLNFDLRHPMTYILPSFGMAICTEVGEHCEPCFHGTLVNNIVRFSDFVWWSSEAPGTNLPHLHHPGEQPQKYWDNLFDFFGYGCYMLPDEVYAATEGRGRCIYYNRKAIKI